MATSPVDIENLEDTIVSIDSADNTKEHKRIMRNINIADIALNDEEESISGSNTEIKTIQKNQDKNQMIQVYILFIIEIFKVTMASFLSMSVIQNCNDKVCGYTENLERHSKFGKFVVGINAANIIAFAILYFYEFNREMFLIQYLDIDKRKGDYHLPNILPDYTQIKNKLIGWNRTYYLATRLLLFLTSINWILSGILVFESFYGTKTITSYATNILLVITKLSDSYRVSKESYQYNYGLSAYIKESTSFNVIDTDHR